MTKKQCPLGEDCDLTIAWMKGAEDARDRVKARIEALEANLAKLISTNKILLEQWDRCDSATFRQSMEMLRADLAEAANRSQAPSAVGPQ
jgi:hypothetical protein